MDSLNKMPEPLSAEPPDCGKARGKSVARRHLINKLNYLNFQDRTIFINLTHVTYDSTISLQARPLPCTSDRLDCVWCETPDLDRVLKSYRFRNFLVTEGRRVLLVEAQVIGMSDTGFSLLLPEVCREVGIRKIKRHLCKGVGALLTQNGAEFSGFLRDFTAVSFRVELSGPSSRAFHWIDDASPVHLRFASGQETVFSGECRIIRKGRDGASGTFVLEPLHHQMHRFKPKDHRSARQELLPSPSIEFIHPLTNRAVSLRVIDLSGSGFSVEEGEEDSLLLPGMILPRVEICFAESFRIVCTAQVVYRNAASGENISGSVKCGLALLDMDLADHVRLVALLSQAADSNSYLCTRVDMDALWRFFFESGFISPEKYVAFQESKEEIKRTYDLLYTRHPGIARHFIYQEKGKILGHMAMIRTYENSWMIHHHAAGRAESLRAGLVVLNQISRYVNDAHHLPSAHLDYVYCYYRPDNKFPQRVFGEFFRTLNNPRGCSIDSFAYFHYRGPREKEQALPRPWELAEVQSLDLEELKGYYESRSAGLMLDAFDLGTVSAGRGDVARDYADQGLTKESYLFSLRKDGVIRALLAANVSDTGLNMSNLTNCITVMVLDDTLPQAILTMSLSYVAATYGSGSVPVLLYPVAYAEREAFACEKLYNLWILNLQYLDQYFDFCSDIFRHVRK
jgi:hypothetical protein